MLRRPESPRASFRQFLVRMPTEPDASESMYLSVVVPCFNEELGLWRLYDSLVSVLPGICEQHEVILVDDGSTDDTLRVVRDIVALNSRFHYVSLSRNFGKEAAMLAGMEFSSGSRVAILDADLQHPPELLGEMLSLLDSGYDQVVARRSRGGERLARSMLTRLYYWGLGRFSEVRPQDGAGDFRVLSRRATDALLSLRERNRFSKGLFAWIGFATASISYPNVARHNGRSKWTFRRLLNYGIDGLISFNNRPLRLSIYLGLLVAVVGCCYVGFVVLSTVFGGVEVPGFATLIAAITGLGGLQLLFLGVLGEYLGRIYSEAKRRPHFLVKESSKGEACVPG